MSYHRRVALSLGALALLVASLPFAAVGYVGDKSDWVFWRLMAASKSLLRRTK